MADSLPSIDLNLREKLRDAEYRKRFFVAEASAHIARQLIELRKRRGLNQKELAELAGTYQPAISRVERADYRNWSFNTLRTLAETMDARIRVLIEPAEDILNEYELGEGTPSERLPARASAADAVTETGGIRLSTNWSGLRPTFSYSRSEISMRSK